MSISQSFFEFLSILFTYYLFADKYTNIRHQGSLSRDHKITDICSRESKRAKFACSPGGRDDIYPCVLHQSKKIFCLGGRT